MKRLNLILLIGLFLLPSLVLAENVSTGVGSVLYANGIRLGIPLSNSAQMIGQTINISGSGNYTANNITIWLNISATAPGKYVGVTLYNYTTNATSGGIPTGSYLYQSLIPVESTGLAGKEILFNFTEDYVLSKGTTPYFLTFSTNVTSGEAVIRTRTVGSDVLSGMSFFFDAEDPGVYWTLVGGNDMQFNFFYTNYTVSTPLSVNFQGQTPVNNSAQYVSNNNVTINTTTSNFDGTITTSHYLYNTSGTLLQQNNATGQNYTSTFTSIPIGTYYFNASATNTTNTTSTETRTIYIYNLTTGSITAPANNTNTSSQYLNVTWTNASITPSATPVVVSYHELFLYNSTLGYIKTLTNTTNLNLTNWDVYTENLDIGIYYLLLNQTDNNTHTATSTYSQINITRNTLINITAYDIITGVLINNITGWITHYETSLNTTINTTGNQTMVDFIRGNITAYITNGEYGQNYTLNWTNISTSPFIWKYYLIPLTIPAAYSPTISQTCTLGTSNVTTFNILDELNLTTLNQTVTYNLYFAIDNEFISSHVYGTINSTQSFSICLNTTLFPTWQINSGEITYTTPGYVTRRHYIFNYTHISANNTNISLYNIADASQTSFTLTIESNTLDSYENKFTTLVRWYPGDNTYRVVDMGQTDNTGSTVIHVEPEDVDYRIGVYELNGSLIYLASPIRMVCLTTPCSYTLTVPTTTTGYTNYLNVENSLTYNNNTGIWTFTWSDPSQTTSEMNLTVYRETGTSVYEVCSSTSSGYVGAVTCNTSAYTGRLHAVVKRSASPAVPIAELIKEIFTSPWTSTWGLWLSLIIIIPIVFVFAMISPVAGIIGGVASLIPAWYFGSITFTIIAVFTVLGGIVLHFAKRVNR